MSSRSPIAAGFLVVHVILGVLEALDALALATWGEDGLPPLDRLAPTLVFWIPLLASSVGVVALVRRGRASLYLWICALYWLFVSSGELYHHATFEGVIAYSPVPDVVRFLIAAANGSFLVWQRRTSGPRLPKPTA